MQRMERSDVFETVYRDIPMSIEYILENSIYESEWNETILAHMATKSDTQLQERQMFDSLQANLIQPEWNEELHIPLLLHRLRCQHSLMHTVRFHSSTSLHDHNLERQCIELE